MNVCTESQLAEALSRLVPDSFDEAQALHGLRISDAEGWTNRTNVENAVWLIQILVERLRDEESFSNELTHMARERAQNLRRKNDAVA
jgi:hypothetical protein